MHAANASTTPARRSARLGPATAGLLLAPLLLALAAALPAAATQADAPTAVIEVRQADLDADHWIAQLPEPDRLILDRAGIAAQNSRMRAQDKSIHDLAALSDPAPRAFVREQVQALSAPPTRALFDVQGKPVPKKTLDALQQAIALDAIPETQPLRYGLVVHRAALRTFPTSLRVFSSAGETDIDRFQESALFPGDAVAVLHRSADGQWLFVASERYVAWIEAAHVAVGDRDTVLGYARRTPYVVVTGATVRTTYTPEEPRVSALQLDMGVRLPLRADWPPMQVVNG